MNKKVIWSVVVVLIIILVVSLKSSSVKNQDVIRIGAIISETGVASAFGEMSHKGIELAAKEINEKGGINGRKVEVVYEDDQTDPKVASGLLQKLTGVDKVDAIIGSNFDFVTQPLFSLASTTKVVVVSPSNPRIQGAFDTNKYSFVMMTEFSSIVRSFEAYLKATEHKQMAIVRFDSSFSESIKNTLNEMEVGMGNKPIISETYKQIGNNDFKTVILKLKQAKVDMVFLDMISIDPVTFVTQAKQLGFSPKIITHVGIQDALSMKEVDHKIFDGVVSINWNVSPKSFIEKFNSAYNINPDKSANRAYDSLYILAQAIAEKGSDALVNVLESKKFTTPNGEFKFNDNHAAANTEIRVEVVKDGVLIEL